MAGVPVGKTPTRSPAHGTQLDPRCGGVKHRPGFGGYSAARKRYRYLPSRKRWRRSGLWSHSAKRKIGRFSVRVTPVCRGQGRKRLGWQYGSSKKKCSVPRPKNQNGASPIDPACGPDPEEERPHRKQFSRDGKVLRMIRASGRSASGTAMGREPRHPRP